MNYVTELIQVSQDSNVNEDDRQAILKSLHDLAEKRDESARLALEKPSTPLQGDLKTMSFTAIFNYCCLEGWGERAFEFWGRWRAIPRDVLGLDTIGPASAPGPLSPWCVDQRVLYDHCKSKGMSVSECHVFLDKLGETHTYYDRLSYDAAACDREGRSISNYRWYLLKLVSGAEYVPEYNWCSHELLQSTLDKFLPIADLTQPLFKEIAGLERELLLLNMHTRNEKVAVITNRPRMRELAAFFTSRPDTKVYLPDSLYHVFWELKQ